MKILGFVILIAIVLLHAFGFIFQDQERLYQKSVDEELRRMRK